MRLAPGPLGVVLAAILATTSGACAHAPRSTPRAEHDAHDEHAAPDRHAAPDGHDEHDVASTSPPAPSSPATNVPTNPPPPIACTGAGQIRFVQATGCQNDGSVEFCLAAGDEAAHQAVRAIAPNVTCHRGSRGRARCDPVAFELCMLPVAEADCVTSHGPMTDAAWERICVLAELEPVRAVVPTFFE